jgi:tetratricopeptide (TPR) repeat protein
LANLTDTVPITIVDQPQDHLAVFYQARSNFSRYFLRYAIDHTDDWPWLEAEHANLMAVVRYCQETDDKQRLLDLYDALFLFLNYQGYWADGLRLNEGATAAAKALKDHISAARFTHDRADLMHQMGAYQTAEDLYYASEQAYLNLGAVEMAVQSRHMRSLVARARNQLAKAEQLCAATIADAERLEMHDWLAHPFYVRALLARDRGDLRQARRYIEASLERLTGSDPVMLAQCQHFLGELVLWQGRLDEARAHLQSSLQLSQSAGILRRIAATQRLLGDVARAEGNETEADHLYRTAFGLVSQIGDQPQQARILLSQIQLARKLAHKQKAISLAQSALAIYQEISDPRGIIGVSLLSISLYLRQGHLRLAWEQGRIALKAIWQARLLQPSILIGLLKRKGKW